MASGSKVRRKLRTHRGKGPEAKTMMECKLCGQKKKKDDYDSIEVLPGHFALICKDCQNKVKVYSAEDNDEKLLER
jgi:hypothetical protein